MKVTCDFGNGLAAFKCRAGNCRCVSDRSECGAMPHPRLTSEIDARAPTMTQRGLGPGVPVNGGFRQRYTVNVELIQ